MRNSCKIIRVGQGSGPDQRDGEAAAADEPLPVLPDPVPRDGERTLARWGLPGEGAEPVSAPGARYPLAGLLLALPALESTGLLEAARQVYGRLKDGFYGLAATLLTLVFLALADEPRAEGATRVPPAALGRVPVLDRAPEVKTIRRKLGELAAAGKAADLIMALARRHAAARPRRWASSTWTGTHAPATPGRQIVTSSVRIPRKLQCVLALVPRRITGTGRADSCSRSLWSKLRNGRYGRVRRMRE